jgi:tetratricopeptide (TPR) repeat protein
LPRASLTARGLLAGLLITTGLVGCATTRVESTLRAGGVSAPAAELVEVPFHPQTAYHCGPAALATVLGYADVAASPAKLADDIYVPGKQGSLQVEVAASARRHGLIAYPVAPRLDGLYREVSAGRPVLVLQDLALAFAPQWHYAVVVGFDRRAGEVVLRSGQFKRHVLPAAVFAQTWAKANHWGLVLLRPGELPAEVERERYLRAVAPLERVAPGPATAKAWRAGLSLWPNDLTALIGLANAHHSQANLPGAVQVLNDAVAAHPDSGEAHNNLAFVLGEQGRYDEALEHARRAVTLGGRNVDAFRDTLRKLRNDAQS